MTENSRFKSSGIEKYQERTDQHHYYRNSRPVVAGPDLNEYSVRTHKGYVSLNELNEKVYKSFGYEVSVPTLPVPTLRMVNEPTCAVVFSEWLRISQEPQPDIPPKEIPVMQTDEFLMNGYAALDAHSCYLRATSDFPLFEPPFSKLKTMNTCSESVFVKNLSMEN
ncbi:hypothetical protein CAEBREN_30340 [Caenorhabditis brenneri]|uniref:Uncharacterized protein n=1 Tax=Caenorhabditis brenneri TaxID=135651 RepID=G0PHE2_CAEBE|nr:hypothetical protein CAEBREN_30340 [Caenorhabditis brenneri]